MDSTQRRRKDASRANCIRGRRENDLHNQLHMGFDDTDGD
jgi:hypothetical protein